MKTKNFLSVLAFGIVVSAFSQKATMELTFTAENNGQHITMDSIWVLNFNTNTDTTLYPPDTVLLLDYITTINESKIVQENSFSVFQNYPNPFKEETTIDLCVLERQQFKISIRDIEGREVAQHKFTLDQGTHSFTFFPATASQYLLTVAGKYSSKTIKMLQINNHTTNNRICELVYSNFSESREKLKSQKATNAFSFYLGNKLKYTAYADSNISVLTDTPLGSKTYTLQFAMNVPCFGIPTVFYEFQTYNTVQIGNQCWLRENLNVGVRVDASQSQHDYGYIEKYCIDDDEANCDVWGGLYQWTEMMDYTFQEGYQGICPDGWHVPTEDEWQNLERHLGMPECIIEWPGWRGTYEGLYLKSETGWNNNGNGTNITGFSGLPGGGRATDGTTSFNGIDGYWWSSTDWVGWENDAWWRGLTYVSGDINRGHKPMTLGISVRCIKDSE